MILLKPPCVILTYHLRGAKISSSERISSDRVGFIPPLADFIAKLYSVRLRFVALFYGEVFAYGKSEVARRGDSRIARLQ